MEYKKCTDMSSIFHKCSSLSELPDISKWNTENITDKNQCFDECLSLLVIPNL